MRWAWLVLVWVGLGCAPLNHYHNHGHFHMRDNCRVEGGTMYCAGMPGVPSVGPAPPPAVYRDCENVEDCLVPIPNWIPMESDT